MFWEDAPFRSRRGLFVFGIDDALIASVAAPLIGGLFGSAGAKQQQDTSMEMAQRQMDFQKEMSSTAWQRATADMKAAGVNPMLSVMQGPASSPGGAMGTAQNIAGAGVSSAMSAMQTMKSMSLMDAQTQSAVNQAKKLDVEANTEQLEQMQRFRQLTGGSWDISNTWEQAFRDAQMRSLNASASSANAAAAIDRERLPNLRLENVPGRIWSMGRGLARPGDQSSAFQRYAQTGGLNFNLPVP